MHYDDETRRFNFVTGLLFGALIGSGTALLVRSGIPRFRKAKKRRPLRDFGANVRGSVKDALDAGRETLSR